ncbi:MAG: hypothetical protein ACRC2T_08735, partial [Thermoguttaceae bacterium]
DADVIPHETWLREIVEPLSDSRFMVSTGHRWYIPQNDNLGSLVRYLWNTAALVQLFFARMPWGGSRALRRTLFLDGRLSEYWRKAISDDMSLSNCVRDNNGITTFVPTLLMPNRETCSLKLFHSWVQRQLLCAKLYNPMWSIVIIQAFALVLPIAIAALLLLVGLFDQKYLVVCLNFASIMLYWIGVFFTIPIIEFVVNRKLRNKGELTPQRSIKSTFKLLVAVPLTQFVYVKALVSLYFLSKVQWRGVWYEVKKNKVIEMVEYKPFLDTEQKSYDLDSI